jgi:hypothetical protein
VRVGFLILAAGIALAGCFGSDDDDSREIAAPEPRAQVPSEPLESVRRSPPGRHGGPPSGREVALAERIMAANAFLGRISDAGGGYRIEEMGPASPASW